MNSHGGVRPGAGRPCNEKKCDQTISIRLDAATKKLILERAKELNFRTITKYMEYLILKDLVKGSK